MFWPVECGRISTPDTLQIYTMYLEAKISGVIHGLSIEEIIFGNQRGMKIDQNAEDTVDTVEPVQLH